MKGVTNCSYFGFFQIDLKKRNIEVVLKFLNAVKGRLGKGAENQNGNLR